jgi:hypothetical protein
MGIGETPAALVRRAFWSPSDESSQLTDNQLPITRGASGAAVSESKSAALL